MLCRSTENYEFPKYFPNTTRCVRSASVCIDKNHSVEISYRIWNGILFLFTWWLHIEQSILVIHGKLIDGSGLREILNTNELSIIGTSVAVDVNDIKHTRYCLQVVVCTVYRKLKEAHTNSNSTLPLMQWLGNRTLESQMCYYWKTILDFQILVLVYIRSIREGDSPGIYQKFHIYCQMVLLFRSLQLCQVGHCPLF